MRELRRRGAAVFLCALAILVATAAVADPLQVKLGKSNFEWPDANAERAFFAWFAEVINESSDAVDVQVWVDFLNDDDEVVHTDGARQTVPGNATTRVDQEGSLAYTKAADVVSYRFRIEEATTNVAPRR
jgi:hypothetical protein